MGEQTLQNCRPCVLFPLSLHSIPLVIVPVEYDLASGFYVEVLCKYWSCSIDSPATSRNIRVFVFLMLSSAGACREGSGCVDGLLVTLTLCSSPTLPYPTLPPPTCYLRDDGHRKGTVEMGVKWRRVVRSSKREKERTGEESQVVMKNGSDEKT